MSRHLGNLTVTQDNVHRFPATDEIYGHLTIAAGARIVPDTMGADLLQVANAPARIIPLSSSSTDPFTFASGTSIPTP